LGENVVRISFDSYVCCVFRPSHIHLLDSLIIVGYASVRRAAVRATGAKRTGFGQGAGQRQILALRVGDWWLGVGLNFDLAKTQLSGNAGSGEVMARKLVEAPWEKRKETNKKKHFFNKNEKRSKSACNYLKISRISC
jgi:hypothetical protein